MKKLSVIIITFNCDKTIKQCLESIHGWVDEIVIFDSGSTDNTLDICRQFTQNVTVNQWPGFGQQKQNALDAANGKWVLSIDSDEIVSSELKAAILRTIDSPTTLSGYKILRPLVHLQSKLKYISQEYKLLLLLRDKARFTLDKVHEKAIVDGKVGKIKSPLWHYSYLNTSHYITKMNLYTDIQAKEQIAQGKKSSVTSAVLRALLTFIKNYFLKLGFLDGRAGAIISIDSAICNYYKYLKISEQGRVNLPTDS